MKQYRDLVYDILLNGSPGPDRTGTGTLSVFGRQLRFDLEQGFPLVTMKKTFWRGAFVEMLWFLRGGTNVAWLHEHGVHIWDAWADAEGNLGPIYGAQWRNHEVFGPPYHVDQVQRLIDGLRHNPHSRRHIIDSWNLSDLPTEGVSPQYNVIVDNRMALAPCHVLSQFYVRDGRLSCQVYQRSADVFLGVPFNIAGYALLTHLLAHHLGYRVGDLVWTGGDVHLYDNHIRQASEMLRREPRPLPTIHLTHDRSTPLWEVEPDSLIIDGYRPHPAIHGDIAV